MLLIASGAEPVLVSVTACAALVVPTICEAKTRFAGVRLAVGAVPVPVSVTLWGLLAALSASVTLALRAPVAVGANVTEIVHVAPAARLPGLNGHVFACE